MEAPAAIEPTTRLIERPRLLALLDEAEARGVRAICLVAPAGYGKTVLAEQWVGSRHPDAILALRSWLLRATSRASPTRQRARRKTSRPDCTNASLVSCTSSAGAATSLPLLERTFVESLRSSKQEPWFTIDDFHLLASGSAEELVERLLRARACRFVVTTRIRPALASAARCSTHSSGRGRNAAHIHSDEAALLGAATGTTPPEDLLESTQGWPLLLALALETPARASEGTREELFDFIARTCLPSYSRSSRGTPISCSRPANYACESG